MDWTPNKPFGVRLFAPKSLVLLNFLRVLPFWGLAYGLTAMNQILIVVSVNLGQTSALTSIIYFGSPITLMFSKFLLLYYLAPVSRQTYLV